MLTSLWMSSGVAQTTKTTTMMIKTTVAFLSLLVAAELGADWIVSIDGLDEDLPLRVLRDRRVCRRRDCLSTRHHPSLLSSSAAAAAKLSDDTANSRRVLTNSYLSQCRASSLKNHYTVIDRSDSCTHPSIGAALCKIYRGTGGGQVR